MKRIALFLALASLVPASLAGQETLVERLQALLPDEAVAQQVIEQIQAAQASGLPAYAVANLALEGVVKGRSGEDVLDAVQSLVADMGRAQLHGPQDLREAAPCPFRSVEEIYEFDAVQEYGLPDFNEQVAAYERDYENRRKHSPDSVNPGGYYNTLVSGAIHAFGCLFR